MCFTKKIVQMTETKYEDWKDHYLTRELSSCRGPLSKFRIAERVQVRDLSEEEQQNITITF